VGAWVAVPVVTVVPVVPLIAFRCSGSGLLNHDDGASWWSGPRRNITRCLGVSWLRFLHDYWPGCASGSVFHDREGFYIIFRSRSFAIMKYLLRNL